MSDVYLHALTQSEGSSCVYSCVTNKLRETTCPTNIHCGQWDVSSHSAFVVFCTSQQKSGIKHSILQSRKKKFNADFGSSLAFNAVKMYFNLNVGHSLMAERLKLYVQLCRWLYVHESTEKLCVFFVFSMPQLLVHTCGDLHGCLTAWTDCLNNRPTYTWQLTHSPLGKCIAPSLP